MCADFVKFPSTPHLLWLGTTAARADKVMARDEAELFLRKPVTVEEKVDGANIGISVDAEGNLLVQNRGNLLNPGTRGQFATLWTWLAERETRLFDALEDQFILFGEWCYARHSIHYTRLPDYFLAFDVFDKSEQHFISSTRRDELVRQLKLSGVPKIDAGVFSLTEIKKMIGPSFLYDGPMEGVYLRQENPAWLIERAKVVRAEFVQQIADHWSKQPLVLNRVR